METQKENKLLIPLAIVVAGALIAGALFFKTKTQPPATGTDTATQQKIQVDPVTASDHIRGNPNAPIRIIEFSDIDCPFCKDFQVTMQHIMDVYGKTGQVAWVYRNFPLDQLHPEARAKAELAECVNSLAGNDVYWKLLDTLFAQNETLAQVPDIAAGMGVDKTALADCVAQKKFASLVQAQEDAAIKAGGQGTPYSIILTQDGQTFPINGAQPYEVVKQVIDTILADKGTGATPTTTP